MSANNQLLVKKYKGKWLLFDNIQAEAWDDVCTIKASDAVGSYDTEYEAVEAGLKLDRNAFMPTEYGVQERLAKDDTEVIIIE